MIRLDGKANPERRKGVETGEPLWLSEGAGALRLAFDSYHKTVPTYAVRMDEIFEVDTLEGLHTGKAGDYLAVGPAGEMYPIDADVFKASYEADDDDAMSSEFRYHDDSARRARQQKRREEDLNEQEEGWRPWRLKMQEVHQTEEWRRLEVITTSEEFNAMGYDVLVGGNPDDGWGAKVRERVPVGASMEHQIGRYHPEPLDAVKDALRWVEQDAATFEWDKRRERANAEG